jgi:hypothetical protein
MSTIFLVLIVVSVLFFVLLAAKRLGVPVPCAMCASVTLSWIGLLVLFLMGRFHEPILLAVLMGQTSIGLYGMLERKVKQTFLLFRLPYILTSILIILAVLGLRDSSSFFFVLFMWIVFLAVYFGRSRPSISKMIKQVIACCKNW